MRSRGLDSGQTTCEKAAYLHDTTSAFDHEDNLDGQSDKQGNIRMDRAMEDLLIRKNLRWTGHFMRLSPDMLPRQVQGYHQEKPEAERHKDRIIDITLIAER